MTGRLASKIVVVTGGGTGIGSRPGDRRRFDRPVIAPAPPALPDGGKLSSNGPAAPPGGCAAHPTRRSSDAQP